MVIIINCKKLSKEKSYKEAIIKIKSN